MTTSSEMRNLVSAYWKLTDSDSQTVSGDLMTMIERVASEYADKSKAGRWAENYIGPVLAAGLTAGIDIHEINAPVNLWKVCGLSGRRSPSVGFAMDVLRDEGIGPEGIADVPLIRKLASRFDQNPNRIVAPAGYLDLLLWICHCGYSQFMHRLARHIGDELAESEGLYAEEYRRRLERMESQNDSDHWQEARRAMLRSMVHPERDDLEALLSGRYPRWKLAEKARDHATRLFLTDYWATAQTKFCAISTV